MVTKLMSMLCFTRNVVPGYPSVFLSRTHSYLVFVKLRISQ